MKGALKTDLTQTHKRLILAHLKAGKGIDLKISLDLFGCASLRSRIAELRQEGWPIRTEMVKFTARSGFPGRFAVYRMEMDKIAWLKMPLVLEILPKDQWQKGMGVFCQNMGNGHFVQGYLRYNQWEQYWWFDSQIFAKWVTEGDVYIEKTEK